MERIVRIPQLLFASLHEAPWLWASALALAIVLLLAVVRLRRTRQTRKLQREIRALGTKVMTDLLVPDSVEGRIHVDYLVLTNSGILVIDVKDYRGMLFGGQNTDIWTQVVDGRSYKFENPLYRSRAREAAVRALAPGVSVRGIVLFTDAGRFPRQRPEGVYMLGGVRQELAAVDAPIPAKLEAAWEQLVPRLGRAR